MSRHFSASSPSSHTSLQAQPASLLNSSTPYTLPHCTLPPPVSLSPRSSFILISSLECSHTSPYTQNERWSSLRSRPRRGKLRPLCRYASLADLSLILKRLC